MVRRICELGFCSTETFFARYSDFPAMSAHIWRYQENQRNYPGYHMSADANGCADLLAWLRNPKRKPVFRLQPVTQEILNVPNNRNGAARFSQYNLLELNVRSDAPSELFQIDEVSGCLNLECSRHQVECIIKGVEDILQGQGDYSIGQDDSHRLWFWWYPTRKLTKKS